MILNYSYLLLIYKVIKPSAIITYIFIYLTGMISVIKAEVLIIHMGVLGYRTCYFGHAKSIEHIECLWFGR